MGDLDISNRRSGCNLTKMSEFVSYLRAQRPSGRFYRMTIRNCSANRSIYRFGQNWLSVCLLVNCTILLYSIVRLFHHIELGLLIDATEINGDGKKCFLFFQSHQCRHNKQKPDSRRLFIVPCHSSHQRANTVFSPHLYSDHRKSFLPRSYQCVFLLWPVKNIIRLWKDRLCFRIAQLTHYKQRYFWQPTQITLVNGAHILRCTTNFINVYEVRENRNECVWGGLSWLLMFGY